MLVALVGKNKIYKITLPKVAVGNYWLSNKQGEKEIKLVNIKGELGKWQISSDNFVKIINAKWIEDKKRNIKSQYEQVINKITLKEYTMYYVQLGNSDELYILYCAPAYEDNFTHLDIKNTSEILIGNGTNNHISYSNPLVKKTHARISLNNGRYIIENYDQEYGTFVNNIPVPKEGKILFNGDVIFIMGLRIIIMGKSIYINNPVNKVSYREENFTVEIKKNDYSYLKKEDTEDTELYTEDDYFARAPRISNIIECEKVKIDSPPAVQSKQEMPLILVLGSTLSMGLIMMVSIVMSIDGLISGTATGKETAFALIMAFAMLISMILFPILNVKYEKKQKKKYEEKRQKRYKDYINSKVKQIDKIMDKQRKILFDNYVSGEECASIILKKGPRLWERKIEEHDFLTVRLGIGDVPLDIDIQYPEEQFAMEDDNLIEILNTITKKSKTLKNAPITISLVEKNISALVIQNNENLIEKIMQSIIMQLIAFQSYQDLKFVFLLKKDDKKKWEYIKMLPHIWNSTRQIRFFTDDYNEMKEISMYLEEDLKNRMKYGENVDYKSFMPYYLIITDDYKKIENLKIIREVLKAKQNYGFSILCLTNNLIQLPNECKTFISLDNEKGTIFESEISSTNKKEFTFDTSQTFFFDKISQVLANIPIKNIGTGQNFLPSTYTFLEMFDVGRIEQLNILERWKTNNSTLSLQAPIGVDSARNANIT